MFYDECLLIEFTNTLYSHIQFMNIEENYNFSSNSTTPLEHKFGFARAKARDIHTLTKFLQTISSHQSLQNIQSQFNEMKEIRSRIHKSVTCESKEIQTVYSENKENMINQLPYSAQSIALYILHMAGFEAPCYCENCEDIPFWLNEILDPFCNDEISAKKVITCNTGKLGTDQCPRIKNRMTGLPPGASRKHMNKFQFKENIFKDICMKKLGHHPPKKEELLKIIKIIKQKDNNCENPPKNNDSKKTIYEWIVNHINLYLLLLDSYQNI